MDKITACLTGFIVFCVSIIVGIAVFHPGTDSMVNTYLAGAFGIISGGTIALPVGYAIGKSSSEGIKKDIEDKLNENPVPKPN